MKKLFTGIAAAMCFTALSAGAATPEHVYLIGNVNGQTWDTANAPEMTKSGDTFTIDVTVDNNYEGNGWFSFITATGANWDVVNGSDRLGAPAGDTPVNLGEAMTVTLYAANVNASAAASWKIAAGNYHMVLDCAAMTVTVTEGGDNPNPPTPPEPPVNGDAPEHVYLVGNVNGQLWDIANAPEMTRSGNTYSIDVTVDDASEGNGWFSMITTLGMDWDSEVNICDRYGAAADNTEATLGTANAVVKFTAGVDASAAGSWYIAAGSYHMVFDYDAMTLTITEGGDNPNPPTPPVPPVTGDGPEHVYLVGNVNGQLWDIANAPEMTRSGNTYSIDVTVDDASEGNGWFSMITTLGMDWDSEVNLSDRFGAAANDTEATLGTANAVVKFTAGVDASAAGSWYIAAGEYHMVFDYDAMTLTITKTSAIESIEAGEEGAAVYYNMQGVRVNNPENGIFIRVSNGKTTKIVK